jgi:hypothetical protein
MIKVCHQYEGRRMQPVLVTEENSACGLKIKLLVMHLLTDVPQPPVDIRVLECGSRDVKLAWNEPHDGNSPILHYTVTSTHNPGEVCDLNNFKFQLNLA